MAGPRSLSIPAVAHTWMLPFAAPAFHITEKRFAASISKSDCTRALAGQTKQRVARAVLHVIFADQCVLGGREQEGCCDSLVTGVGLDVGHGSLAAPWLPSPPALARCELSCGRVLQRHAANVLIQVSTIISLQQHGTNLRSHRSKIWNDVCCLTPIV